MSALPADVLASLSTLMYQCVLYGVMQVREIHCPFLMFLLWPGNLQSKRNIITIITIFDMPSDSACAFKAQIHDVCKSSYKVSHFLVAALKPSVNRSINSIINYHSLIQSLIDAEDCSYILQQCCGAVASSVISQ